ncbi:MAG: hypothetical protein J6V49_01340 [Bacteroidales bacterium]|nr:hypothetical protein [Bacteroidales bacterium]
MLCGDAVHERGDKRTADGKLYWKVYQYAKKIPYQKEIVIRSEPEVLKSLSRRW